MPKGVSLMHRYGILSVTSAAYARFHLLGSSNNKVIDHFCVTFLILSDQLIWGESSVPLPTWRIVRFMTDEKAARLSLPLIRFPPWKSARFCECLGTCTLTRSVREDLSLFLGGFVHLFVLINEHLSLCVC